MTTAPPPLHCVLGYIANDRKTAVFNPGKKPGKNIKQDLSDDDINNPGIIIILDKDNLPIRNILAYNERALAILNNLSCTEAFALLDDAALAKWLTENYQHITYANLRKFINEKPEICAKIELFQDVNLLWEILDKFQDHEIANLLSLVHHHGTRSNLFMLNLKSKILNKLKTSKKINRENLQRYLTAIKII